MQDGRTDMTKEIVAIRCFAQARNDTPIVGYLLHRNARFSDLPNVSQLLGCF